MVRPPGHEEAIPRRPPVKNKRPKDDPAVQGDVITPFYVSDGWLMHTGYGGEGVGEEGRTDIHGIQLVCWFYIPIGRTGFIKQIRVAPYIPAPFDAKHGPWNQFDTTGDRPAPLDGFYTTPAGWENYGLGGEPIPWGKVPFWRWHLRAISGDISGKISNAKNNFDVFNPNTWQYLTPYPVPTMAYPQGIPGRLIGDVGPQKIQRVGNQYEESLHIPVNEDTSITLWTEWKQEEVQPKMFLWGYVPDPPGPPVQVPLGTEPIAPINPSFGALIGYTQPNHSDATRKNAVDGWGG